MKKLSLETILAFSFPALILVLIIGFAVLPPYIYSPVYDFVYTENPVNFDIYNEEDEEVIEEWLSNDFSYYIYDLSEGTSTGISEEEMEQMALDTTRTSPDGFRIESQWHQEERSFYMTKNGYYMELDLPYSYRFTGWITPENHE